MDPTESRTCPACGTELPADAAQGLIRFPADTALFRLCEDVLPRLARREPPNLVGSTIHATLT